MSELLEVFFSPSHTETVNTEYSKNGFIGRVWGILILYMIGFHLENYI